MPNIDQHNVSMSTGMESSNGVYYNPKILEPSMKRATRCVCAIESGRNRGTGLLIGPDLVLTAYHVIDWIGATGEMAKTTCLFDYAEEGPGKPAEKGEEIAVLRIMPSCFSQPSPGDFVGKPPVFVRDFLDYAILQLVGPMGRRPARDGLPRGWNCLPRIAAAPELDSVIYLFQHPQGENFLHSQQPLRYDFGQISDMLGDGARWVHTAYTAPGASGGPCFDMSKDFAFIGIHNAGHETEAPKQNRFVPLHLIISHLRRSLAGNGFFETLFEEPLPPDRPAAMNDANVTRQRSAALYLMDRAKEEIQFRQKAEFQPNDPSTIMPRVHVIVCRNADKPSLFTQRLEYLPLNMSRQDRIDSILDGLAKGELTQTFGPRSFSWPEIDSTERRTDEIDLYVSDLDTDGRQLIVFMGTYEDGMDVASERSLIEYLAGILEQRFKGAPGTFQCVVCLAIPDQQADADAIVRRFATLWAKDKAPPGCGVCIELSEITSTDLLDWRETLKKIWGESDIFDREVDSLFSRNNRHRMALLVEELGDDIDQLIRAARPGATR